MKSSDTCTSPEASSQLCAQTDSRPTTAPPRLVAHTIRPGRAVHSRADYQHCPMVMPQPSAVNGPNPEHWYRPDRSPRLGALIDGNPVTVDRVWTSRTLNQSVQRNTRFEWGDCATGGRHMLGCREPDSRNRSVLSSFPSRTAPVDQPAIAFTPPVSGTITLRKPSTRSTASMPELRAPTRSFSGAFVISKRSPPARRPPKRRRRAESASESPPGAHDQADLG
jgi:hypothetical protein